MKYKRLYKGFTTNIFQRLKKHNLGLVKSTKPYIPYKLIYYEAFLVKEDALRREKILKSKWGTKFLKRTLEKYLGEK